MDAAVQYLLGLANQNPNLAALLLIMGVLRAIFKPAFALLDAYVEATPDPEDNVKLAALKESKAIKALAFILDYVTSVKLK